MFFALWFKTREEEVHVVYRVLSDGHKALFQEIKMATWKNVGFLIRFIKK